MQAWLSENKADTTSLGSKTRVTEINEAIDLNILVLPREDERTLDCASTSVVKISEKKP